RSMRLPNGCSGFNGSKRLLCNRSAGNPISGVPRRVGLHVVAFGVNNDRRAAIAEQRIRTFAERDILILELTAGLPVCIDAEIRHVASVVAFGVLQAVFFGTRIEVRSSRLKIRPFTLRNLMEMNGMLSGRQVVEIELNTHSRTLLP